ncbi:hypothetical protein, partial [Parendozoicomonas sp. Alg238-R29]|uniref:hypothetical protein n=1 Tax=Parendozoicomonas sp. Alg238-R29 TaxID=2993446 RepID=UPI00248DA1FF
KKRVTSAWCSSLRSWDACGAPHAGVRFQEFNIEISLLILGWLLGLLSPRIVSSIKDHYERNLFFKSAQAELLDLQYRLAFVEFILAQKFGVIDKEHLAEIRKIIFDYEYTDDAKATITIIDAILKSSDDNLDAISQNLKADSGYGLNLKNYSTLFIDANGSKISKLPNDIQFKIYDFKNNLSFLNQDINLAKECHKLTFDSAISSHNHARLVNDIKSQYSELQKSCRAVRNKIQIILESNI